MSDPARPDSTSSFPDAQVHLRRAQWLWRGCLLLPCLYLGVAFAIDRLWFSQQFQYGFWPMSEGGRWFFLAALGVLAVGAQVGLVFVQKRFAERFRAEASRPGFLGWLVWRRAFYSVACSDTVSCLGLVAFVCNADWIALIVFCGCSYLLYAQCAPPEKMEEI